MTTAQSNRYVVWFTTPTCQPCKRMTPAMDKVQQRGVVVEKLNVHDFPEEAKRYDVSSVPTLVLVNDGTEVKRATKALTYLELIDFLS